MYAQKTVYSINISHKAFRATGADEAPRATRKCAGNMTKDFFLASLFMALVSRSFFTQRMIASAKNSEDILFPLF